MNNFVITQQCYFGMLHTVPSFPKLLVGLAVAVAVVTGLAEVDVVAAVEDTAKTFIVDVCSVQ